MIQQITSLPFFLYFPTKSMTKTLGDSIPLFVYKLNTPRTFLIKKMQSQIWLILIYQIITLKQISLVYQYKQVRVSSESEKYQSFIKNRFHAHSISTCNFVFFFSPSKIFTISILPLQ